VTRTLVAVRDAGCRSQAEWARYWQLTIIELRDRILEEGELDHQLVDVFSGSSNARR
jgi:hypothetical protein